MQAEVVFEGGRDLVQHGDIRACAEELFTRAAHEQYMDVFIETRLQNSLVQLAHHIMAVSIGGQVG